MIEASRYADWTDGRCGTIVLRKNGGKNASGDRVGGRKQVRIRTIAENGREIRRQR